MTPQVIQIVTTAPPSNALTTASEEFGHQLNASPRGNIGKPNQAGMTDAVQIDEPPEVLVEGRQYPIFTSGTFEQRAIAWILSKLGSIENIVPLSPQPCRDPSPHALIDEELHDPAILTADRLSPAMTA